jgi:hypothetical protein
MRILVLNKTATVRIEWGVSAGAQEAVESEWTPSARSKLICNK